MGPIAYFQCASHPWSEDNPNQMSHDLQVPGGWYGLYEGKVKRAIEVLKYRRVAFHLPFGKATEQGPRARFIRAGEKLLDAPYEAWDERQKQVLEDYKLDKYHMSLRQLWHLEETGQTHIRTGFLRMAEMLHEVHPEVMVSVYLGSEDDYDRRVRLNEGPHAVEASWDPIVMPFEAMDNVQLVFDNLAIKEQDTPHALFCQRLQRRKIERLVRTGFEARLTDKGSWLNNAGWECWCWERQWNWNITHGVIPYDEYKVPVVRVLDGHAEEIIAEKYNNSWLFAAGEIARAGHTPAVEVWDEDGPFYDIPADEIQDG